MRQQSVLIATRNQGKLKEFARFFADFQRRVVGLEDYPDLPEPVEDGQTYLENARKKALALQQFTGLPVLADDSGLEVDALNGQPGVYSARFAGETASDEENNRKLLALLEGVPLPQRTARFRCVLVYLDGQREWVAEGVCEGLIAEQPQGNRGFGYDPLFYLPDLGCTMAELDPEIKNRLSHRGQALRQLKQLLAQAH